MHEALAIPELMGIIAHECKSSPRSLVSLALTRRSFTEPSLDALYGSVTIDLFDLALLFPFARPNYIGAGKTMIRYMTFDRDSISFSRECWERFNYLAQKTRTLRISFDSLSDGVFVTLLAETHILGVQKLGRPILFPFLRALSIANFVTEPCSERPYAFALVPFLTDNLNSLSVYIDFNLLEDCYFPELRSLNSLLPSLCPNLEALGLTLESESKIELDEGTLMEDCYYFIKGAITDCERIASLDINVNCFETAKFLRLPLHRIKHLSLQSLDGDPPHVDASWSSLPLLESVDLNLDIDIMLCVMKGLGRPALTDVQLTLNDPFDNGDSSDDTSDESTGEICSYGTRTLKHVLRVFAEHTSIPSLRNFSVTYNPSGWVAMQSLRPLHLFKELQDLRVSVSNLQMRDSEFVELIRALPKLQALVLPDEPGVTLGSLISVSKQAIHLVELTMRVDSLDVPPARYLTNCRTGNTRFERLTVHESPISSAIEVSRFLRFIFPSIVAVQTTSWELDSGLARRRYDVWTRVSKFIQNQTCN